MAATDKKSEIKKNWFFQSLRTRLEWNWNKQKTKWFQPRCLRRSAVYYSYQAICLQDCMLLEHISYKLSSYGEISAYIPHKNGLIWCAKYWRDWGWIPIDGGKIIARWYLIPQYNNGKPPINIDSTQQDLSYKTLLICTLNALMSEYYLLQLPIYEAPRRCQALDTLTGVMWLSPPRTKVDNMTVLVFHRFLKSCQKHSLASWQQLLQQHWKKTSYSHFDEYNLALCSLFIVLPVFLWVTKKKNHTDMKQRGLIVNLHPPPKLCFTKNTS